MEHPNDPLDLTSDPDRGIPSSHADPKFQHSKVTIDAIFWKTPSLRIAFEVQGPYAVAAGLCVVVLGLAVCAALLVPQFVLPDGASTAVRVGVAAATAVVVLAAGAAVLNRVLGRRISTAVRRTKP
jgi:hypothetical protein